MSKGIDPQNFDTLTRPQDDFYQYVNGGWLKNNPIPDDEFRWGAFIEIHKRNSDLLHSLLEEIKTSDPEPGSDRAKIKDFYITGMDEAKLNSDGYKPLQPYLDKINNIQSKDGLAALVAELQRNGVNVLWDASVTSDDKASDVNIFRLFQAGLGLPDRDYYFKEDEQSQKTLAEYKAHITRMFVLLGQADPGVTDRVMSIETWLAKASMNSEELRDLEKQYHKYSKAHLAEQVPAVHWEEYLQTLGVGAFDELLVNQPAFMQEVNQMLVEVPLADWQLYLTWRLISAYADMLSDAFVEERFAFYGKVIKGAKELQPRWRRVLARIDRGLGEALGKEFVSRHFKPEAKQRMVEMVQNLIAAFEERLQHLDWMTEATKLKALVKLKKISYQIGYPDVWRDYSSLLTTQTSLAENWMAANRFECARIMNRLGKPVDKNEWYMTPPTVNAYIEFWFNQIVFPAGILQPVFFDLEADDAVNYGAIGSVIGHELTHAFDDKGSLFDENGSMNNWWTDEDHSIFEQRASLVAQQYDEFTVLGDLHINGKLTLGENISDLGGVLLSFQALQKSFEKNGRPENIDNLTPEQRFFIGFAQAERQNTKDEAMRTQVLTDPHSPSIWRVNGPVVNVDAWYEAFDVKEGDALYRKPEQRIKIW